MAYPYVSIIIPVFNDPEGIQTTMNSILSETKIPNYEIIIVDNNSSDNTSSIARDFTDNWENVLLVFEKETQSSYAARNTGLNYASGDTIIFFDADQRVSTGWLKNLINHMKDTGSEYLSPEIELGTLDDPGVIAKYNIISGFPINEFMENHQYAPTSCLCVTRDLIENVGEFDDRLISGGDLEFGNRVAEAGYELAYAPSVTVIHPPRRTARALIRRNFRIGRGHCQLQQYYPNRYGTPGIPPRPSGIRQEQYDGSLHPLIYRTIATFMTVVRGAGYYSECLRYFARNFRN